MNTHISVELHAALEGLLGGAVLVDAHVRGGNALDTPVLVEEHLLYGAQLGCRWYGNIQARKIPCIVPSSLSLESCHSSAEAHHTQGTLTKAEKARPR